MPFQLNNRLDILDKKNKWLEATVVHIYSLDGRQCGIKVKFKGFTSLWDENINTECKEDSWRIKPVGTFSKAHGWAKDDLKWQQEMKVQKGLRKPSVQYKAPTTESTTTNTQIVDW